MITQTIAGGAIVTAIGVALIKAIAPVPAPISVHGLAYDAGFVTQDRTINGSGDVLFAMWAATVVDAETGTQIPGCSGDGSYAYPVGRKAPVMTLARWLGTDDCAIPPGLPVKLQATWMSGDFQTSASSAPFTVD